MEPPDYFYGMKGRHLAKPEYDIRWSRQLLQTLQTNGPTPATYNIYVREVMFYTYRDAVKQDADAHIVSLVDGKMQRCI